MKTSFTVSVRTREFASEFSSDDSAVTRLIKRTVPPAGREFLPESRSWLIYSSRVPGLLAALDAAGIEVVDAATGGTIS